MWSQKLARIFSCGLGIHKGLLTITPVYFSLSLCVVFPSLVYSNLSCLSNLFIKFCFVNFRSLMAVRFRFIWVFDMVCIYMILYVIFPGALMATIIAVPLNYWVLHYITLRYVLFKTFLWWTRKVTLVTKELDLLTLIWIYFYFIVIFGLCWVITILMLPQCCFLLTFIFATFTLKHVFSFLRDIFYLFTFIVLF